MEMNFQALNIKKYWATHLFSSIFVHILKRRVFKSATFVFTYNCNFKTPRKFQFDLPEVCAFSDPMLQERPLSIFPFSGVI